MKSKRSEAMQRGQKLKVQEAPNWVFVVGGALLSTLSVRLWCKLKQVIDQKRLDNAHNGIRACSKSATRRPGHCSLHANSYCFTQDEDRCYHCLAATSEGEGRVEIKEAHCSPLSKNGDLSLQLVAIPGDESSKDNAGIMWISSPDRLELPPKPFHHSTSSGSPSASESGSDIFTKREVIQKLRQQLKRRDEMIMEMHTQITELQNSLSSQMAHSTHLQSLLDAANHDLFDSEIEIQRLRKAIADHCLAEAESPKKPSTTSTWHADANGHGNGYALHTNGYADSRSDRELHCIGVEKSKDELRFGVLKAKVGDLKEVIEGKELLLQSYKEQKMELSTKLEELQLRFSSQTPNIL